MTQVGGSLSNAYYVWSVFATVLKIDAGIFGVMLSVLYQTRKPNNRNVPGFISTTAQIFMWLGGALSIVTLIVTIHEMHNNTFGVVWTVLLILLGQNILEIMCFIYIVFFTYRLFSEYNHALSLDYGESKEEKETLTAAVDAPYQPC